MSVKISIDQAKIRQKIENASEKALWATTSEILNDCQPYVKRDTGALEQSALVKSEPQKGVIVWDEPYAKRQYWEIKTANTSGGHPNATWKWFEYAKKKNVKRWKGLFGDALKRFL